MYENWNKNQMGDGLDPFERILNEKYLVDGNFFSAFSHVDLFREKVKYIPISVCPVFQHCDDDMAQFAKRIEDGM